MTSVKRPKLAGWQLSTPQLDLMSKPDVAGVRSSQQHQFRALLFLLGSFFGVDDPGCQHGQRVDKCLED